MSSGMLSLAALLRTDVSEELSAYTIRVTRIGELGTTLVVTSNRGTLRSFMQNGTVKNASDLERYKQSHSTRMCNKLRNTVLDLQQVQIRFISLTTTSATRNL
jgi:hypothetical protein